ncbi:hypothetical protein ABVK25_002224 [Lepraria finkii]|uniref:Uncharacterized protein n=1 Tax=Lepraria finkii TaxID=1340010 RepID=A0ABR4BH78_9LECA
MAMPAQHRHNKEPPPVKTQPRRLCIRNGRHLIMGSVRSKIWLSPWYPRQKPPTACFLGTACSPQVLRMSMEYDVPDPYPSSWPRVFRKLLYQNDMAFFLVCLSYLDFPKASNP